MFPIKKFNLKVTTCFCFTFLASICHSLAAIITFDLRDTLNTSAIESGSIAQSGLTLNLTSAQGDLNQTASSFGVNHTGGSADESALLDGNEGAESIHISFDQNVTITSLTLSGYASGGAETANFTIASFTAVDLIAQAAATDSYDFTTDNVLNISQTAQLNWLSGNGFSFDSITVETVGSVVPEPSSMILLGISTIILTFYRSRRTK